METITENLKHFDYFFFNNCAVKVTAKEIQPVDYMDIDFCIDNDQITKQVKEYNYTPVSEPLFEIVKDPEYDIAKSQFEERMSDKRLTENERKAETALFTYYERLWKYKLNFNKPMEELPPTLQILYDTSRVHWRIEEAGDPLTSEQKQRQDMHFISKVSALGFLLSRYRAGLTKQIALFVDYSLLHKGYSTFATGKSMMHSFLSSVRNVCYVPGFSLRIRKEHFDRNFAGFNKSKDSIVFVDDILKNISMDDFLDYSKLMFIKRAYVEREMIHPSITPRICITSSYMPLDMNDPAIDRSVYIGMFSDYYHPTGSPNYSSDMTPLLKFGKDVFCGSTDEEQNQTAHFMMQCCQFYLANPDPIIPPVERTCEDE